MTRPLRSYSLCLFLVGCGLGGPKDEAADTASDADGDGVAVPEDCDDGDAAVHPGATEVCDVGDVDEDCSGAADNADPNTAGTITVYRDADSDGWGDVAAPAAACEVVDGYSALAGDCDEADPRVNPAASEVCDARDTDEDCDGLADDADDSADPTTTSTVYADADGDGFGDAASTDARCDAAAGWSADATDCDDRAAAIHPTADELCNAADDDCDGAVDEADAADAPVWYLDDDGDGYGDAATTRVQCAQPSGYVADGADCDDVNAGVHPGADERCDGRDDDCDGDVDEDDAVDAVTWYEDADGDSYGSAADMTIDCDAPAGYVALGTDCDDRDASVNPAATEACDALDVDEDCDGLADDADTAATGRSTWYADSDGDGFGDRSAATAACSAPAGFVADGQDCDDADALVSPACAEVCDARGADEDCDGLVDDVDPSVDVTGYATWYRDADDDGYGSPASTTASCDLPVGYSALPTDCDDADRTRSPARTEVCDAADTDEDCDGYEDDADASVTGTSVWYRDSDGDGYGDDATTLARCDSPSGYVPVGGDCADSDGGVNPGEVEDCSTVADENCDGIGLCEVSTADADRALYGAAGTYVGGAVAGADLDGDGVQELVTGAEYAASSVGEIYVFAGDGSGTAPTSAASATWRGERSGTGLGGRIVRIGDVDGDGADELALGAYGDDDGGTYAGAVFIVSGLGSGTASLASSWGKLIGQNPYDQVSEVGTIGDEDGDGLADVGIGGPSANRAWIYAGVTAGDHDLSGATAVIDGESVGDYLGTQLAGAGDTDGDGIDDFVVSAPWAGSGAVYLFQGPVSGVISAAAADGKRTGSAGVQTGTYMAERAGDVDGDGHADLLVGVYSMSATEYSAWLVPGPMTGTASVSAGSVKLHDTVTDYCTFGRQLAGDGDFDGDGHADVVVTDSYDSEVATVAGAASIYFGPLSGTLTQDDADVTIRGESYQQSFGDSVSFVGPHSGTTDELLFGAPGDGTFASYGGAAYLFSLGSL